MLKDTMLMSSEVGICGQFHYGPVPTTKTAVTIFKSLLGARTNFEKEKNGFSLHESASSSSS